MEIDIQLTMDPKPNDVLEKATAVAVSNPEQAMIMLQTLGEPYCNSLHWLYVIWNEWMAMWEYYMSQHNFKKKIVKRVL